MKVLSNNGYVKSKVGYKKKNLLIVYNPQRYGKQEQISIENNKDTIRMVQAAKRQALLSNQKALLIGYVLTLKNSSGNT